MASLYELATISCKQEANIGSMYTRNFFLNFLHTTAVFIAARKKWSFISFRVRDNLPVQYSSE